MHFAPRPYGFLLLLLLLFLSFTLFINYVPGGSTDNGSSREEMHLSLVSGMWRSLGAVCVESVVGGVSFSGFCRRFLKLLGEVVACEGGGRLSLVAFQWAFFLICFSRLAALRGTYGVVGSALASWWDTTVSETVLISYEFSFVRKRSLF